MNKTNPYLDTLILEVQSLKLDNDKLDRLFLDIEDEMNIPYGYAIMYFNTITDYWCDISPDVCVSLMRHVRDMCFSICEEWVDNLHKHAIIEIANVLTRNKQKYFIKSGYIRIYEVIWEACTEFMQRMSHIILRYLPDTSYLLEKHNLLTEEEEV